MHKSGSLGKYSLSFILAGIFIASCGGGGGGGTPQPVVQELNSNITVTVTPQTNNPQLSSQTVKLRKLQTEDEFRLEIISADKNGNQIDRRVLQANPGKPLSVKLKLNRNGGTITIKATANGYNEATKSVKYNDPEEVKTLNLELTPIPVKVQIVNIQEEGVKITSEGKKYIRFAIFKDAQGLTKLAIGDDQINKQNYAKKLIDVAIPLNKLQDTTTSLKVEYKAFKPSNPDDYKNFPGEETEEGQKLVSFGFDYLKITDQDGNNPFKTGTSQGLSATLVSGEYYRILREVDCEQIQELKNSGLLVDEDPNKEGIQFTFYAFDWDKGAWVKAGQGVFVSNDSIEYMSSTWDYIIQNGCDPNPESQANCSNNGVITDINEICSKDDEGRPINNWVVISVTNPELAWKNLDYVVPEGKQKCCTLNVRDDSGNSVGGAYVYVEPDENSNIEWTEGYTDENGDVRLCTLAYSDNNLTGVLYVINPYTWEETIKSIDFSNCPTEPIVITNPYKCTVEGKVVDDNGNPISDAYVYAYTANYITYRATYTDENGYYSLSVPCQIPMSLQVNSSTTTLKFNVNFSQNNDEINDDGTTAELRDYILPNTPPQGYVYAWDDTIKAGKSVNITVCAWDWEGDYPITYSVNAQQGAIDPSSGQIDADEGCEDITYTAPQDISETTVVKLDIIFKDSAGKESSDTVALTITPENTPPVGYIYGTVSYEQDGYRYYIYAYAYDEDGDNINWSITNSCNATSDNNNDSNNPIRSWGELNLSFISDTNTCTFTLTLDDGKDRVTKSLTLTYTNLIPSVYLWTEEGVIVPEGRDSIKIYAYISDDDENWVCKWFVNGEEDTNTTSCEEYTLDLSNANSGDTFEIKLCATDPVNNKGCGSITIYYGGAGNANITIQNK